ncbi:MAG TPA: hypothetical protein VF230_15345 [Acidimicrobiales bacterium]
MRTFIWPADDGWPYPDGEGDQVDVRGEADDDLLSVTADRHLLDGLDPLERRVIKSSFGLGGAEVMSVTELHRELGVPDTDIQHAMGTGLAKLKAHLQA